MTFLIQGNSHLPTHAGVNAFRRDPRDHIHVIETNLQTRDLLLQQFHFRIVPGNFFITRI